MAGRPCQFWELDDFLAVIIRPRDGSSNRQKAEQAAAVTHLTRPAFPPKAIAPHLAAFKVIVTPRGLWSSVDNCQGVRGLARMAVAIATIKLAAEREISILLNAA